MDDGTLILLGLACIVGVLLGPIGFFLTLGARSRLRRVEAQLALLAARAPDVAASRVADQALGDLQGTAPFTPPAPSNSNDLATARNEAPSRPEEAVPAPDLVSTPAEDVEPAPTPTAPPPLPPAESAPRPALVRVRKIGLEERLGARWAVIVGGLALALGVLLLVKYSIEQGYFGPGARVVGGLLLGFGLIAAGEYLRRKEQHASARMSGPSIPAVLTCAGTVAAFGSLYAAHALYGFIGPTTAFILLGALAIGTMFAAALHGPALAGLGLVGALVAPLLVTSSDPSPWPVVLFVAIVCAAAYALARIRRWLWLAAAAAAGAACWQVLLLFGLEGDSRAAFGVAGLVHLVVETLLVVVAFAVAPHLATPHAEQRTDRYASIAILAYAALAALVLAATSSASEFGTAWIVAAALVVAIDALTGMRMPAAASASAAAGLVILAALASWGPVDPWLIDGPQSFFTIWPAPRDAGPFIGFGLAMSALLAALGAWRLINPSPLSFLKSAIYAGVSVLTPLAALSILYLRLSHLDVSSAMAATAGGVALAMAGAAVIFDRLRARAPSSTLTLGLGAFAAGAIAALSLGLVFALSEGTLTVALALAALGSALVGERLGVPALRWCAMALGLAVAGRFAYEPRIVGAVLGKTIIFNWLLFGYGVPALAFGLAARLMRRSGEDAPMRVMQALSILCSALLLAFEIRHALNDGDPFSPSSGMVEQGLFTLVGLLFSLVLMELNARRADPVYSIAALCFSALTLAQALAGLLFLDNPYFSSESIQGGGVVNALILGYGLPALAALILAQRARGRPPEWRRIGAASVAIALLFAYANLELRRLAQGNPQIGYLIATSEGEFYAYSALWLGLGVLFLAYGILASSKPARLASAALVSMTVVKVFILDLSGLEGVLRALSFLGLGAALIGIGLVYQKFVFGRPPGQDPQTAVPGAGI